MQFSDRFFSFKHCILFSSVLCDLCLMVCDLELKSIAYLSKVTVHIRSAACLPPYFCITLHYSSHLLSSHIILHTVHPLFLWSSSTLTTH